ncbi:MAG: hypothetical protein Fur0023_00100 [Bacteroidia bacterium]
MRNKIILIFLTILLNATYSQTLKGKIQHFANRKFALYVMVADSMLWVDSVRTDASGQFSFPLARLNEVYQRLSQKGIIPPKNTMLRIQLHPLQYTDVFVQSHYSPQINLPGKEIPQKYHPQDIDINLVYNPSKWDNWARDSTEVTFSEENKELYRFWKHYRKVQVAESWLLDMSRLFPHSDEFSKILINEYYKRYKQMNKYVQSLKKKPDSPAKKTALAYYRPVLPDFRAPDGLRFDTIRAHFWDYFDPNDSLFAFGSVLIDKFEEWVYLHHHHKDSVAGLYLDRTDILRAIKSFVDRINKNHQNRMLVLNYVLKKLDMDRDDKSMFMAVYDEYLKPAAGDCDQNDPILEWAHHKADIYRNIVKGALSPDFEMTVQGTNNKIFFHQLPGDYVVLIFWASWCPHCRQELPNIKAHLENWKQTHKDKNVIVLALSLDTSSVEWSKGIKELQLEGWLHYSELRGWNGDISKKYNVRATPTIVVVDREKKIYGVYGFIEKAVYEMK